MDDIQTFVSVAQQVIDTAQQVITKVQETQAQQVASKETQQVVSKETRPQDNKYFWKSVMATILTGTLLYTMTLPRVTIEETHEQKK